MLYYKKMRISFLVFVIAALFATGFTSKAAPIIPANEVETAMTKSIKVLPKQNLMESSTEMIGQAAEEVIEEEKKKASYEAAKKLLAAIIFCEAGNQPYEGQVAVGAVVMNRVKSGSYPDSIEAVIYQKGQFGPASTGWLDKVRKSGGYTDSAMKAAADALDGANPVGSCLYFDKGGNGTKIGDHYFH